jgi:hypothetical protein
MAARKGPSGANGEACQSQRASAGWLGRVPQVGARNILVPVRRQSPQAGNAEK